MPYKLISLVFLLFISIINKAYSENEFLLPAKKPSIFKKNDTNVKESVNKNLPQPKPLIKKKIIEKNSVEKILKPETSNTQQTAKKIEKKEINNFFFYIQRKNLLLTRFHLKK